ncbi:PKD domain-containing protein [Nocardioides sp.]|uniref:PKD domain-containing protein n=1 Tax=Nocardioides sp. TaxID=35761 RepID=UPI0026311FED|nr:PKD domain-containing protein [Nocardioides sp.]
MHLFRAPHRPRTLAATVALTLATAGLAAVGLVGLGVPAAQADTAPADTSLPATVSADPLPTVQIDGVVWKQLIVGNTVYVGGEFANARPAGAAAGTNLVPRSNFLAYNLTTGDLITTFAPSFNAQVKDLAVSPDGTKLYVVGSFTSVNGTARYRAAQFDLTTGALTAWKPTPNSTVNSVAASNSTVVLGGAFGVVNNTTRVNVAAVSSAPAATLLPFNPTMSDGSVQDMAMSPDGSQVVIAGSFTSVNGSSTPGYGLARLDLTSSALLSLPVNTQVRDAGTQSGVLSLETDGTNFYGSGYHFGGGGNMEGAFSADWATGTMRWIEDCHGDTYSAYPVGNVVYEASHKHYCGNSGGFPQTNPWTYHHSTAVTNDVRGTNTADIYGYPDHAGQPRPEFLDWYPVWATGTYTGKGQAVWTVTGNSDYVLYGGEFPKVGNVAQQGLVRFARAGIAPNKVGPTLKSANFNLTALSVAGGAVRLTWPGNPDPDNATITYKLYRSSTNDPPIYQNTVTAHFWQMPVNKYIDTGLTPGSSQRYRVVASDPYGNTAMSDWITVTVASSGTLSTYASDVLAASPDHYWRLGEGTGTTSYDWGGVSDLTRGTGTGWTSPGAITGDTDGASTFSGDSTGVANNTDAAVTGPDTFSVEAWFKTATTRGGKIVGFGNASTGTSGSYDRHVYMTNAGKLIFGVYNNTVSTLTSPASYNDNAWHHVVAEMSSAGMALYVDGVRVARRSDVTTGQAYAGYWHIGGDNLNGWTSQPTSNYFNGSIDDVAVYPTALSTETVRQHYTDSGRSTTAPAAPTDAYGKAVYQADPDLYWRFAEPSGSAVADSSQSGGIGGTLSGSYTRAQAGPLAGVAASTSAGVTFAGTQGSSGASNITFSSPQVYTLEAWFKTTSTSGGKIIGFGNAATGNSSNYDRHVYLTNDGKVVYGIYNGGTNTITTTGSYNDGAWHQVVASQGPGGMRLYLDGVLQGTNAASQAEGTTGYWRIGGDVTWGSSSNYLAGTIAEVAVYPTVLDAATVSSHYTLGSTGQAPNQLPTAAFTSSMAQLAGTFDGSGSADPDGSIASYAWDFGDGSSATGATPTHTYAAAGTYTVTLTVTDNRGGTGTVTHQVTAVANQAPTAAFTATPTGRTVAVDGSASADPDGSVTAYAWDFGDGSSSTGATASHTYAADGTYTVTLDVTDDSGAHGTVSHDVTVAAPTDPTVAADSFGRSASGGWGTADNGGAWTSVGTASRFSVAGGLGLQSLPAGITDESRLNAVAARDVDVTASVGLDKLPGSNYVFAYVGARQGSATGYAARVRFNPDGTVGVHLLADNTALVGASTVPGITVAAGERVQVRFQAQGTSPTTLRVKIWKAGTAEPSAWTYTRTDSTAADQVAGAISLKSYSPTVGNSPIAVSWDDLAVVNLP